jgi:NADH dehydrogenase
MAESEKTHRVVIVGAGFAGFNAARELSRLVGATTEVVVINSTDYFLYLPLMPQVTGGLVEPSHIRVSLPSRLRKARFVLGTVNYVDPVKKVVSWAGPEGAAGQVGYDRLILTAGSVNQLLPIPGIADYVHGFRTIAEAMYLRDHIIRQLELASVAADPAERAARCTFVVVGAGYTGTEVTAHGQLLTARLAGRMPGLAGQPIRWMLLDTAPRLLPDLDPRLSKTADRVLRRRGVEVRTRHAPAAGCDQAADAREAPRIEVPSIGQTRGSGERPLAVGCGGILARELGQLIPLRGGVLSGWCQHPGGESWWQGEAAAKGRARPLAASERMFPPASTGRAIQVGSQRGLRGPQSASFDWRGGRHARCHCQ